MPLTKIGQGILPGENVNAGSTSSYSSTVDLTRSVRLAITASVTYALHVTQPCVLQVFGSVDGGIFDTYPFASAPVPIPDGGGRGQITISVPADTNYVRCNIQNVDPSLGVSGVQIWSVRQEAT